MQSGVARAAASKIDSRVVLVSGRALLDSGDALTFDTPIRFGRCSEREPNTFVIGVSAGSVQQHYRDLALLASDLNLPRSSERTNPSYSYEECSTTLRFLHALVFSCLVLCRIRLLIKGGQIAGKHAGLLRQRGLQLDVLSPPDSVLSVAPSTSFPRLSAA